MAVKPLLANAYARQIFLDGTRKFEDLTPEYQQAVKVYAYTKMYYIQLDRAIARKYVSQTLYDEVIAEKLKIISREDEEKLLNASMSLNETTI